MELLMLVVFIGYALAFPYCFLSGVKDEGGFLLFLFVGPIVSTFLYDAYHTFRRWDEEFDCTGSGKSFRCTILFFSVLVGYVCLPILMNGASIALRRMGCTLLATYFFEYRFFSLLVVLVLFLAFVIIANVIARQVVSRDDKQRISA